MNNYVNRVFEMLVRVGVFWSAHRDLIGKDSPADRLFQQVDVESRKISAHSTSQTSGSHAVRKYSAERTSARIELRKGLESVSRTATSMGSKEFFMPRARGDRALADVARLFVQKAEPLKDQFIANRLPEDFIERLRSGIESIERSIEQQAASKSARKEATTAIATARSEALQLLSRLDPIMENLTNNNEPLKAVWLAARRIEKQAARKAVKAVA